MESVASVFFRAAAYLGIIDKENVLQLAARNGHTSAVRALLKAGADIHAHDDEALRTAAWWGRAEAVKALLEGGADAYARHGQALDWAKEKNIRRLS